MKAIETKLKGCFILEPTKYSDNRGFFFESFNQKVFNELIDKEVKFVQDNQSFSRYGVLRGLHIQIGEYAQAKLVRVLSGRVVDVAVDIRPSSDTFGQHVAVELSAENSLQLFIPRGFLHGFIVLSDFAEFFYKCDNFYNREFERGVIFNDIDLSIDWILPVDKLIVSDKDLLLPSFKRAISNV